MNEEQKRINRNKANRKWSNTVGEDGLTNGQRRDAKRRESRINYKRSMAKERYKNLKHDPVVYLIVKENYVGTTENLYYRVSEHKSDGKDVSEVSIIKEFKCRLEALEFERSKHKEGYLGCKNTKSRYQ